MVNDVHIRYEDRVSVPSIPFCVGVTIKHLSTQPSLSSSVEGCVLKEVHLEDLAVFWNFGNNCMEDEVCVAPTCSFIKSSDLSIAPL